MAQKLAMVIDASGCIDCKACLAACKVANQVPAAHWRNWIKNQDLSQLAAAKKQARFQPGGCMQCNKPTCVEACPTGATYKSAADGVVQINRDLCIGCGQCIKACPYGARYRHPELRVADKCDFCVQRRADGLEPACVSTCPTKTRVFGDLNDPKSQVSRLMKEKKPMQVANTKSFTDPNLYYVGDPGIKDWPVQAEMPAPYSLWKTLAGPLVKIFVGLNALGVLAMLGKQMVMPGDAPSDEQGGDHA